MGGPKTTIDCNQSSQDFFTIEGLEIPAGQEENPACVEKTPTTTPEVQPPPCEDNFLDQLQTGFTTPASNGTNAPATVPNNPDINAANLLLENLYKDVSEWEGPTAELIIAHLRNTEYTIQISPKTALTTLRNIEKLVAIAQNFESLPEEIKNSKL